MRRSFIYWKKGRRTEEEGEWEQRLQLRSRVVNYAILLPSSLLPSVACLYSLRLTPPVTRDTD